MGESNIHGVLMHEMFGRCNLNVVSLGSSASELDLGIWMLINAATLMSYYFCHSDVSTSEHLPLSMSLLSYTSQVTF